MGLQQQKLNAQNSEGASNYQLAAESEKTLQRIQSKAPNFGFDNLMADWNYLQFIQYFGDTPARDQTNYNLIPYFFESIVRDDPLFIQALLFLSTANTMYAARPQTTVNLLDKALEKIPPDLNYLTPYVWSYKGVDEILFLNQIKAAIKSYEMSAQWAKATKDPDLAEQNQQMADFLKTNPDSKKVRVFAWMSILNSGITKETQEKAIEEINGLGGTVDFAPNGRVVIDFPDED